MWNSIAHIQAHPENKDTLFQVASNFNAVEAQSELVKPNSPQFTEKYYMDRTQGPAASISAGEGVMMRIHAPFYSPSKAPEMRGQTETSSQIFFALNYQKLDVFKGPEPIPKVYF